MIVKETIEEDERGIAEPNCRESQSFGEIWDGHCLRENRCFYLKERERSKGREGKLPVITVGFGGRWA